MQRLGMSARAFTRVLRTLAGAAVSVAGNFVLIPSFGLMGAAWAALFSYLVMAAMMYLFITIPLTRLVAWMERRTARSR